jgi:DNA-binding response OmpR family regulator
MAKARILIVEDNPFMSKLLQMRLKANEYEVSAAVNGKDALLKVINNKPDLILLDVNMPQLDGFETARALKADPETKNLPIIFVTAKGEEQDILKAIECGAVSYIIKPFTPERLLDEISKTLGNIKNTR